MRPGAVINDRLMLVRSEGRCAVMCGVTALHVWDEADRVAERVAMFSVVTSGLATRRDVGHAFGVHENTVQRLVRAGLGGVIPAKPGPKRRSKLTPEVLGWIAEARQRGLRVGKIVEWLRTEHSVVVSQPSVSWAVKQLSAAVVEQGSLEVGGEIAAAEAGLETATPVPEARSVEPEPTRDGAPVVLPEAEHGRYMGLALYYPALAAVGLVEAARRSLRLVHGSELFGIRAVVLTLFFLSLLRKPTLESAKHLRRLEFGAVVGSGRAPCVKTLRRKLGELAEAKSSPLFSRLLARHWVDHALVGTAHLYVDGHVKVYSGKRQLEDVYNTQRRMPLPGIVQYFVGDQQGRPLVVVSEGVTPSLSKSLPTVVRAVREVIGERPLTLIFDRGGYDAKLFTWLRREGIDFITYQRGEVQLPADRFRRRETRFEGRRVRMQLAEDTVSVKKSGPWRRIVVRVKKSGHQTPILTSLPETVGATRIASLMFCRWRQENFFRYMRQHHGLDTLVSYLFRDASDQLAPNPEHKRLDRELAQKRAELRELEAQLGVLVLRDGSVVTASARATALARQDELKTQSAALKLQRRIVPKVITVAASGRTREVMELERKRLVDEIKLAAYNAEEWLLDRLAPHYHNPFDTRDLLRAFAELSGSIHTTHDAIVVTLDPPDTPAHRVALRALCDELNRVGATFPGTRRPVRYAVAVHHSEPAA